MAIEERNLVKELGNKDRDTQRQREAGLIRDANYNKKYKECRGRNNAQVLREGENRGFEGRERS